MQNDLQLKTPGVSKRLRRARIRLKPPRRRIRIPQTAGTVGIALGMILAAEVALRFPGVRERLPEANLYYQQGVLDRLEAIELTRQQDGPIDAAFIGSSIVRTNVDPLEFDRRLQERGIEPFVSFNCGLSGLLAPVDVRLYLNHRWFERVQPRIVFQGLRLFELKNANGSGLRAGQLESLWIAQSDALKLRETVLQNIYLLHYRGELFQLLRHFQDGHSLSTLTRKQRFAIDRRGHQGSETRLSDYREFAAKHGKMIAYHPELRVVSNSPPARPPGGIRSDRPEFSFVGVWDAGDLEPMLELDAALAILSQTIRDCRERGIVYVLVNMPEHGERYPGPEGECLYAHYTASLQRFADAEGVPFLDVTAGDPRHFQRDEWYSDFHHMNSEGARHFSRMLADAVAREMPDQLRRR